MKTIYLNSKKELNGRRIKKITKKLYKLNKKEEIVIVLNKQIENREELINSISNFGLRILNGRWLLKFLIYDLIEYVSNLENKKIQTQNVTIILNNYDDVIITQIIEIAKKIKNVKIVAKDISRFSFIENELYLKYGIAIQVTNNKNKALINSDIIINIDLEEEKLLEYKINPLAIIINIKNIVNQMPTNFKGKNFNNYKIEYNKENYFCLDKNEEYNTNILYESYIYKRDTFNNIYSQIKKDDVKIINLS